MDQNQFIRSASAAPEGAKRAHGNRVSLSLLSTPLPLCSSFILNVSQTKYVLAFLIFFFNRLETGLLKSSHCCTGFQTSSDQSSDSMQTPRETRTRFCCCSPISTFFVLTILCGGPPAQCQWPQGTSQQAREEDREEEGSERLKLARAGCHSASSLWAGPTHSLVSPSPGPWAPPAPSCEPKDTGWVCPGGAVLGPHGLAH